MFSSITVRPPHLVDRVVVVVVLMPQQQMQLELVDKVTKVVGVHLIVVLEQVAVAVVLVLLVLMHLARQLLEMVVMECHLASMELRHIVQAVVVEQSQQVAQ